MSDSGLNDVEQQLKDIQVPPEDDHAVKPLDNSPIPGVQPMKFKVYEWLDEYGDVPPHNDNLQKELFEVLGKTMTHPGAHLDIFKDITVTFEGRGHVDAIQKFEDAGLHPVMMENLDLCGYKNLTSIQSVCIPAILQGQELLACAQTGTGKTAAYLIPIFSRLMGKYKELAAPRANVGLPMGTITRAEPLVLIVTPTRELALQIFDHTRRLCYRTMLRPACVFGGGFMGGQYGQRAQLANGCDILIGTPGRLVAFLDEPHILSLRRVKYTILDEADELLTEDWLKRIDRILFGGDANLDADHKLLMFSATFSEEAREVAQQYMGENYSIVSVGRIGSSHGNIEHEIIQVDFRDKREKLYELLSQAENIQRTIIFCNSKLTVDRVDDFLFNKHLPVICTHSARKQEDREEAMRQFRSGEKAILVTTAMFARGIDVAEVYQILNFDLPSGDEGMTEFVHRIGRTARMGNKGHAISFFTDRDSHLADGLASLLKEVGQEVPEFMKEYINDEGDGEAAGSDAATGFGDSGATGFGDSGATGFGDTGDNTGNSSGSKDAAQSVNDGWS